MKRYDVIVLGMGIAGLSVAIPLARRGRHVLVMGRKGMPGQSTGAAGGILDPFFDVGPRRTLVDLRLQAFFRYPAFIRQLEAQTGIRVRYVKTGLLQVAKSRKEIAVLKKRFRLERKTKVKVRWLERADLLRLEPGLSKHVCAGLHYPEVGKVNPLRLHQALVKRAKKLGVIIHKGAGLSSASLKGPRIVNALGSWAGRYDHFGVHVPVVPARGQILLMRGKLNLSHIVHSLDGGYIVPWENGEYLLGSTVEFVGYRPRVTRRGVRDIRRKVECLLPAAHDLRIRKSWAGLRPYPADGLPLIGETAVSGYYMAAGYYRSGILIGPYGGELLAKMMMSGKIPTCLKPFDPKRLIRKRKS